MQDYHIHPDFSFDAKGSVDEFCQAALLAGLVDIAFTTHYDTNPVADYCYVVIGGEKVPAQDGQWLEQYENTIRHTSDKYKNEGLTVQFGVELDCYPGVLENLPERFFKTEFDFVLGSAHILESDDLATPDGLLQSFKKYSPQGAVDLYYALIIEAMELEVFDVLSHLDVYRRFGEDHCGGKIFGKWESHVEELAKVMNRLSIGFEINTSTWRQNQTNPMPEQGLVKALGENGVNIVTVGSDSHRPNEVGAGIDRAYNLLKDSGFSEISLFENRRRTKRRIP